MKLILTIILLTILGMSIWSGFKKGLIRGIASILVIVISLFVSSFFADKVSGELVPALDPFVGGFIDSGTNTEEILNKLGYGGTDLSLTDILTQDTSLRYDYAYEAIRSIGFTRGVSEDLADDSVRYATGTGVSLTEAVIVVLSHSIAYIGCVTIAFIMMLILLTAVMDLINLDFHLPNVAFADEVAGAALGLVKGFLYCVLLCWLLGFLGLLIGKETCEKTPLVNFFLAFRFITQTLI